MSAEFLLTSLVVVLLPGTGVLYTLAVGLGQGFRAGTVAAFGCTLGIVPHIFASIAGLSVILHTSALAFEIIRYLGVAYLLYMAWSISRERGALQVPEERTRTVSLRIVRNGFLLNVLNPKLSLFFLAFLPQFVDASAAGSTVEMLGLALVFMIMTFAVFVIYGACAALARDYVISRPTVMKWLRRSFAAAFAALALKLALTDR